MHDYHGNRERNNICASCVQAASCKLRNRYMKPSSLRHFSERGRFIGVKPNHEAQSMSFPNGFSLMRTPHIFMSKIPNLSRFQVEPRPSWVLVELHKEWLLYWPGAGYLARSNKNLRVNSNRKTCRFLLHLKVLISLPFSFLRELMCM
jgi:hypothetical protein